MLWRVSEAGDAGISLPGWNGAYPYTFGEKVQPDLKVSLRLAKQGQLWRHKSIRRLPRWHYQEAR